MSAQEATPLLSRDVKLPLGAIQKDDRAAKDIEVKGYMFMTASTLGFSGMSFLVHLAERLYNFPMPAALLIRATVQVTLSLVYMLRYLDFKETFSKITARQWKLLAVRGAFGAVALSCFFASLHLLPIGEATTIFFCAPALTIVMSNVILGEPITATDSMAAVLSFVGVVLIAQPEFDFSADAISRHESTIGILAAFGSAFFSVVATISMRCLGTGVHFIVFVLDLGLCSTILALLLGGASSTTLLLMRKEGIILVLVASLFGFLGQCLVSRGLQLCRAGPGMLLRNLDVPVAYTFGLVFLGETASMGGLFGSSLVLLSTVIIGLRQIA